MSSHAAALKAKSSSRIGPYIMTKTLGTGSTGRVKLGTHQRSGQKVAIKIIPRQQLSNGHEHNFSRKIEREITVMKLIQHPNVMALYDVYETNDELFLVLEHVEGGELFDYLVKKGRLDENEACNFFQQIIFGLDFCHNHQICHRDLKPENLLLDASRNIKLADFGMASLQQADKMLETSCGSPHYASPEIIKGIKYDGALSDIWSCGVILYALLSGNLPFDDENIRRLLSKVKTGKYFMPTHISPQAQDLIHRMLQVEPEMRIRMKDILAHSWFNKVTPKMELHKPISDKILANTPVQKDDLDPDVVKSLGLLGWDDESKLIQDLLSAEPNPQKIFYHLLVQRKVDYFDSYEMGDDEEFDDADTTMPRRRAESYASIYLDRKKSENNLLGSSANLGSKSPNSSKGKVALSRDCSQSNNSLLNASSASTKSIGINQIHGLAMGSIIDPSQSGSQLSVNSNNGSGSFRNRAQSAGDTLTSEKKNVKSPLGDDTSSNSDLRGRKTVKLFKGSPTESIRAQHASMSGLLPDGNSNNNKSLSIAIPDQSSSSSSSEVYTPKFHRRKKDDILSSVSSATTPSPNNSGAASPKRSWFAQLFNIKSEVVTLSSKIGEKETIEVLRNRLQALNIKLQDGKGYSLKCKGEQSESTVTSPVDNSNNATTPIKKIAKFRVDVQRSKINPILVDVQFVLQQGPVSVMTGIISTLQKDWDL